MPNAHQTTSRETLMNRRPRTGQGQARSDGCHIGPLGWVAHIYSQDTSSQGGAHLCQVDRPTQPAEHVDPASGPVSPDLRVDPQVPWGHENCLGAAMSEDEILARCLVPEQKRLLAKTRANTNGQMTVVSGSPCLTSPCNSDYSECCDRSFKVWHFTSSGPC